ncbi:hypothetical protein HU200_057920 [Digitaria exilis]|uniref:VQ domain-containing protein n=1 Tax=Digitaria exilis TaxID=1010633 RepID=A0A835E2K3_9POAL|nr:hypothetical protein HU200_057920 [Digitaria exilis]
MSYQTALGPLAATAGGIGQPHPRSNGWKPPERLYKPPLCPQLRLKSSQLVTATSFLAKNNPPLLFGDAMKMKHTAKLPSRGSASSSPANSAHRLSSHSIAKAPPRKIRIIHVLAPEVIKTEARHFRDLVQRLTGMPPSPNSSGAAAFTEDASSSPPPHQDSSSCDSSAREAAAMQSLKVKEEPAGTSSGDEGGGFLRALELDGCNNDMFFRGLEDFLNMDDMDAAFNF